ncbi:hypothetical protein N7G274_002218 [Stereocaulon virgatum]|uniref:Uncharacterized protein n=1 Tax=Stereocaulon virgatum TaxID=373712 RepID=A0ABR4AJ37_9LECA
MEHSGLVLSGTSSVKKVPYPLRRSRILPVLVDWHVRRYLCRPRRSGMVVRPRKAPLQMFRELNRRALWIYINCVSLYTTWILTKWKDIRAAFNGISNLTEKTMRAPFIFGLPSSRFDMVLLWEPQSAIKRRVPKTDNERAEYGGMQFPSWSWCGWTGDAFDLPTDNKSEYKASRVDGCLPNVQEWLMNHTWIH